MTKAEGKLTLPPDGEGFYASPTPAGGEAPPSLQERNLLAGALIEQKATWTPEEAREHGLLTSTAKHEVEKLRQSIDGMMTFMTGHEGLSSDPLALALTFLVNRVIGVLELLA